MDVVGTMFFKDKKLLIDKPRKRPTYQMIGGKVEEGETPLEAAIRECHEELGNEAIFDSWLLELMSDPTIANVLKWDFGQIKISFTKPSEAKIGRASCRERV